MQKKEIIVLGISPGTRTMGIAIFRNNELAEWKLRRFSNEQGKARIEKIITGLEKLIDEYEIKKVAIKAQSSVSNSNQLNMLILDIQQMLKQKRIQMYNYSLHEMKRYFSTKIKIASVELFDLVRNQFCVDINKQRTATQNLHYAKMYEAIACAKMLTDKNKH